MLFEFFKNKNTKPDPDYRYIDEPVSASIAYYIKTDGSGPYINIQLEDYDDDSIASLCELLDTLAEESFYSETIEMIKSSLIKNQHEELLIKIFAHVSKKVRDKILRAKEEAAKDEPCISPSDMI